ncbi:DUF167 domain-containing protein [Patescibacteria group bacterium]
MKKVLIHAIPNAKKNEVKVIADNILKVKVSAPPINGKANKELIKILSKHYKIHKSDITFIRGVSSDKKVIGIPD